MSPYFSPLRASGRLFWAPYYAILAATLAAPFLLFRKAWANVLIAAMLILQFADTSALRHWVHTTISEDHPSPLKSPIWSQLGAQHQNLIVLPAWQCEKAASPGGPEGYRIFGFLAVEQKMRINSYQSARYTGVAQDFQCSQAVTQIAQQGLAPDSAYVVMPERRRGHRARSNRPRQVPRLGPFHSVFGEDGFRTQPGADDSRSARGKLRRQPGL